MYRLLALCSCGILLCALAAHADVKLARPFSDNMVLQRDGEAAIWGTAAPGETVTVTFREATATSTADKDGRWRANVKTGNAGGPFELTVTGANTIVLKNVLVGEVWLGSGQSNMNMSLMDRRGGVLNWEAEAAKATDPNIRFFQVTSGVPHEPRYENQWTACTPDTAKHFSAILYFFARRLSAELQVPIGVMNVSEGGSKIDLWLNGGNLYNDRLRPVLPYTVRGILWCQGEANIADSANDYAAKMTRLIEGWRKDWGSTLPFYYVQIAPYLTARRQGQADIWDAMQRTLALPATGMVSTLDIGDLTNVHPKDKQTVAARLANLALREQYGRKELAAYSPRYRSLTNEGYALRIHFDHAEGGLATSDDTAPDWVQVAGADKIFRRAQCRIDGETLLVSHPGVPEPVAVRFAWDGAAEPNLIGRASRLPVLSFRTDDWALPRTILPFAITVPAVQATDEQQLAEALGTQPAYEINVGGHPLASAQLVRTGTDLLVQVNIFDARAGTAAEKEVALELFGVRKADNKILQIAVRPALNKLSSSPSDVAEKIQLQVHAQARGYRVLLRVPLAFYGLTEADTTLRLELAVTATYHPVRMAIRRSFFGSLGTMQDSNSFAIVTLAQ